jgi:hypothetical protein
VKIGGNRLGALHEPATIARELGDRSHGPPQMSPRAGGGPRSSGAPLGAVTRGLTAAAVGTLAMDVLLYVRYRRGGGERASATGNSRPDW